MALFSDQMKSWFTLIQLCLCLLTVGASAANTPEQYLVITPQNWHDHDALLKPEIEYGTGHSSIDLNVKALNLDRQFKTPTDATTYIPICSPRSTLVLKNFLQERSTELVVDENAGHCEHYPHAQIVYTDSYGNQCTPQVDFYPTIDSYICRLAPTAVTHIIWHF
jgi:hypothetical protein